MQRCVGWGGRHRLSLCRGPCTRAPLPWASVSLLGHFPTRSSGDWVQSPPGAVPVHGGLRGAGTFSESNWRNPHGSLIVLAGLVGGCRGALAGLPLTVGISRAHWDPEARPLTERRVEPQNAGIGIMSSSVWDPWHSPSLPDTGDRTEPRIPQHSASNNSQGFLTLAGSPSSVHPPPPQKRNTSRGLED